MRIGLGIGIGGIAVAALLALGGCGGGSDETTTLALTRCDVYAAEDALHGLEAGIAEIGRGTPAQRRNRGQALRAMRENAAVIRVKLRALEECPRDALREAEGKKVDESAPPRRPPGPTVVAYRVGPARVEPGEQSLPASPCSSYGKNGTTTLYIWPDSPGCARVAPGERLRVANRTGIGRPADAVAVQVRLGDYELWLGPDQEGLIPAPVETYLGRGSHSAGAVGGLGPTVLLLPRVCAVRPPAAPSEELCFR